MPRYQLLVHFFWGGYSKRSKTHGARVNAIPVFCVISPSHRCVKYLDTSAPARNKVCVYGSSATAIKKSNMIILRKFIPAVLIAALVLFTLIDNSEFFTIDTFKSHKQWIDDFISKNYFFSVFVFFIACVIFINTPVPFAALMKVLSGFFFGFYLGTVYNIAATTLACLVGFSISRYAFKSPFERAFYQSLKTVEDEIANNGFYYFLTLRLIMVAPYFIINIVAGISRISFRHFLLSTLLGVIPMSLVYANGGNQLEHINSISDLFKVPVVLSLLLVAILSGVPLVLKKNSP